MRLEIADTPVSPQHIVSRYKEARQRLMGSAPVRAPMPYVPRVALKPYQRVFKEPVEFPLNAGAVSWTWGAAHSVPVKQVEYDSSNLTVLTVVMAVADYFNFDMNDMRSDTRSAPIAYARHVAMYLARKLTTKSLPAIGRVLGGRDHTTILHGIRKIERQIAIGAQPTCSDIKAIRRVLEGE
jgi:hypothetical protein